MIITKIIATIWFAAWTIIDQQIGYAITAPYIILLLTPNNAWKK